MANFIYRPMKIKNNFGQFDEKRGLEYYSEKAEEKKSGWCSTHVSTWDFLYPRCLTANQLKRRNIEILPCEVGK